MSNVPFVTKFRVDEALKARLKLNKKQKVHA